MMTIADLYDIANDEADYVSIELADLGGERFEITLTDWDSGEVYGL